MKTENNDVKHSDERHIDVKPQTTAKRHIDSQPPGGASFSPV